MENHTKLITSRAQIRHKVFTDKLIMKGKSHLNNNFPLCYFQTNVNTFSHLVHLKYFTFPT